MEILENYYGAAGCIVCGLLLIGPSNWTEYRREKGGMPSLMPTTPFMLLGVFLVLGAIVILFELLFPKGGYFYIALAMLAFGFAIIGLVHFVERRRQNSPKRYLSSTTPFMLSGGIIVLVAIAFLIFARGS
jgi:uncharacterized membrane protein YidH (DUF202 family)